MVGLLLKRDTGPATPAVIASIDAFLINLPGEQTRAASIDAVMTYPGQNKTFGANSTDTVKNVITDTTIVSELPTTNFGTDDGELVLWQSGGGAIHRAALYHVDLSALPDDAQFSVVRFRLTLKASPTNAATLLAYESKRSWQLSQATWNVYTTGNNWSTAGGRGSGTDVTGDPAADSGNVATWSIGPGTAVDTQIFSTDLASYCQAQFALGHKYFDITVQEAFEENQFVIVWSSRGTDGKRPSVEVNYWSASEHGQIGGPGATGIYTSYSDGLIYDPAGAQFTPKGTSLFPGQNAAFIAKAGNPGWKFNIIRMVDAIDFYTTAQVDASIDAWTAAGYVVIADFHLTTQGGFGEGSRNPIPELTRLAAKYKNNVRVWYSVFCEAGGLSDTVQVGGVWTWAPAAVTSWTNLYKNGIAAIRGQGATAPIVVGSMAMGSDVIYDSSWQQHFYLDGNGKPAFSSILANGPLVNTGVYPYVNIIWDVHCYENYNDPSRLQYMRAWMLEMRNRGQAFYIGEYGARNSPAPNPATLPCSRNLKQMMTELGGWGRMSWTGGGGGTENVLCVAPNTSMTDINSNTNPTNLTELGQICWDDSHAA